MTIHTLNVWIADDPYKQAFGLMNVKSPLPLNHGMLFIYTEEANHTMWMKNTYIPLDLIFLDKNRKVIGFVENMKPLSLKSHGINKESLYAIEVNAGYIKDNKIRIGDIINFQQSKKKLNR